MSGWPDAGLDGVMQVPRWCDAGLDVLMQVLGWCDAGPRIVRCRSSDGAMQVPGCANFRNGNSVGESRNTFEKNQCYRLNVWAIIQPLPCFHFWVDPLFNVKHVLILRQPFYWYCLAARLSCLDCVPIQPVWLQDCLNILIVVLVRLSGYKTVLILGLCCYWDCLSVLTIILTRPDN